MKIEHFASARKPMDLVAFAEGFGSLEEQKKFVLASGLKRVTHARDLRLQRVTNN